MSKKLTSRDYKQALTDVLSNGYNHILAINNEIMSMKIDDPSKASIEDQQKLKALTLTMTLVNDLLHPAHEISKSILKNKIPLIEYCQNMQKVAFDSKLVDLCECNVCKKSTSTDSSLPKDLSGEDSKNHQA